MPTRASHGTDASDDTPGTETDKDENAMLMYHRIGTPQGTFSLYITLRTA